MARRPRTRGGIVNRGSRTICGVNPGPVNLSLLTEQEQHRSVNVWDGHVRSHANVGHHRHWELPEIIRTDVYNAGFEWVCKIRHYQLDRSLITALVERWRPETHSFHFRIGEMTITLEDVHKILGLRMNGEAVTGPTKQNWGELCDRLLGKRPEVIKGSTVTLAWIERNFKNTAHLSTNINDRNQRLCYARAYILYLIGSTLCPDSTGGKVTLMYLPLLEDLLVAAQYSWGSATLACLYRALCTASRRESAQIWGNLTLLQLWAWEHLSVGRPQIHVTAEELAQSQVYGYRWRQCRRSFAGVSMHDLKVYRDQLDTQKPDEVIWDPYSSETAIVFPANLREDLRERRWRCRIPLICFFIVEWHYADRVMRQFGCNQHIPDSPNMIDQIELHKNDRKRCRRNVDWSVKLQRYIDLWDRRHEDGMNHFVEERVIGHADMVKYLEWYNEHTRHRIGPPADPSPRMPQMTYRPTAPIIDRLVGALRSISQTTTNALRDIRDETQRAVYDEILGTCRTALRDVGESSSINRTLGPRPVLGRPRESRMKRKRV